MKLRAVVAALCALLTLAGCAGGMASAGTAAAGSPPELLLTFDENAAGPTSTPVLLNAGTASAQLGVVTVGTRVVVFEARPGEGSALVLPAYTGLKSGPFTAITVRADGDWLSPGGRNFGFGADVKLNAKSSGTTVDNGDNVMQRGLYQDPAQYKIQVDGRRPSCHVRGTAGIVVVRSRVVLGSGWYRLRCDRSGPGTVTLTVTELDTGVAPEVRSVTGALGKVVMADRTLLSVGAKLGADGRIIVASTDQFNGRIDNVTYSVDG